VIILNKRGVIIKIHFRLKRVRKLKNLTQLELSMLLGLSQSYISELELCKISPTLVVVEHIINILNICACDLIDIVE